MPGLHEPCMCSDLLMFGKSVVTRKALFDLVEVHVRLNKSCKCEPFSLHEWRPAQELRA